MTLEAALPETLYAESDGLSIAYKVFGTGAQDLVARAQGRAGRVAAVARARGVTAPRLALSRRCAAPERGERPLGGQRTQ